MFQKIIKKFGVKELKKELYRFSAKKVFLVTGKKSYYSSKSNRFIHNALGPLEYVRFSDFDPNPKIEDAVKGFNLLNETNCNLIIAIGGGSVIDMAKLISVFYSNQTYKPTDLIKNSYLDLKKKIEIIAIPTTAGAGSESTHFAVVYENNIKYSLASELVLPVVVGLNTNLTISQSPINTAYSGLDALAQAIESYWSLGSNSESDIFALKAIPLIFNNLLLSVKNPSLDSRKKLLLGSNLAGQAINISKTTAAHAFSYAFTTYFNITHGHAVLLTLPFFINYNFEVTNETVNGSLEPQIIRNKIINILKLLNISDLNSVNDYFKSYLKDLGIESNPQKLGISKSDLKKAIDFVNLERLANNPRKVDKNDLYEFLLNEFY